MKSENNGEVVRAALPISANASVVDPKRYWEMVVEDWLERMSGEDRENALGDVDVRVMTTAKTLAKIAGRSIDDLCPPGTGKSDTVKLLWTRERVIVDLAGTEAEGFLQVTTKRGTRDHFMGDLDENLPEAIEALFPKTRMDLGKKHFWVSCYSNRDIFLTFCLLFRFVHPQEKWQEVSPHVYCKGDRFWSVRFFEGEAVGGDDAFYGCWTTSGVLGKLHRLAEKLASEEPKDLDQPALVPTVSAEVIAGIAGPSSSSGASRP